MATHPEDHTVGAEQQAGIELSDQGRPSADSSAPSHIELLLRTVETELIPRLFVNHLMDVPSTSHLVENLSTEPTQGPWSSQESIIAFSKMCISNDPQCLDKHVTDLLSQGVTLESIFLYLLTPTARYLGDGWLNDKLSFVDVHLGLCRLHQLICDCESIGYHCEKSTATSSSILLSCTPGEDHTFGITMVADFFRRYGWSVSNLCGLSSEFVLQRLESTHYAAVGFSLHNEYNRDALADIIRKVRAITLNKDLVVMVGGDYFARHPTQVRSIGADIFASDGRQAVIKAVEACKLRVRAL